MTFASQSLFIDFAFLLWAFDVKKARDATGAETTPSLTDVVDAGVTVCAVNDLNFAFHHRLTSLHLLTLILRGPAPFKCKLVARHKDVAIVLGRSST